MNVLDKIKKSPFYQKMESLYQLDQKWFEFVEKEMAGKSRVKCLDKQLLIVEVDHPAVLQMLSMSKNHLLSMITYEFPELKIEDIKFILG